MDCGKAVEVTAQDGAMAVRFIAQCGGAFMVISNMVYQQWARNGCLLADWRGVVRELVALAVPEPLGWDKAFYAGGAGDGLYHNLRLTYPLSVKELSGIVGEDVEAVRELLADLAVQAE